jgi:nitroreductase
MSQDEGDPGLPDLKLPTNRLALRLAGANGIIRRRRSIKPEAMSDEPVETWILGNILENANWAPTHGLTEPWRFKVYEGAGREKLADLLQQVYRETTPADQFRQEKCDGLRGKALGAPVVIVIWMHRQKSEKIPEIEEIAAVACAVQNIHLTASAVGMAGYWSTPAIVYTEAMRTALGLAEKDRCLGLFYLGWPKDSANWPMGQRQPIQEKVEWFE